MKFEDEGKTTLEALFAALFGNAGSSIKKQHKEVIPNTPGAFGPRSRPLSVLESGPEQAAEIVKVSRRARK